MSGATRYVRMVSRGFKDWSVVFGNGSKPAALDDFRMDGSEIELDVLSSAFGVNKDSAGYPYIEKVLLVTNNTGSTVSIGEIGSSMNIKCARELGDATSNSEKFLLERTVLMSPIVINNKETVTINYRLTSLMKGIEL